MNELEALVDDFAERVARKLHSLSRQEQAGWISQHNSPLGRRHCSVVRVRVQLNKHGCSIIGRRHLLSNEALAEELKDYTAKTRPASFSTAGECTTNLRAELDKMGGE